MKNRCAWLNHSEEPQVFVDLVRRFPNIRLWFSGIILRRLLHVSFQATFEHVRLGGREHTLGPGDSFLTGWIMRRKCSSQLLLVQPCTASIL